MSAKFPRGGGSKPILSHPSIISLPGGTSFDEIKEQLIELNQLYFFLYKMSLVIVFSGLRTRQSRYVIISQVNSYLVYYVLSQLCH